MHFPMLASLVTLFGLVSVACAVPAIRARGNPVFSLSFLNQNDPVGSLGKPSFKKVALPTEFEKFFDLRTVREGLGYPSSTIFPIQWTVNAQDDNYAAHLNKPVPIYAVFVGGPRCYVKSQCLAIVVDESHGIISTKNKVLTQVGDPVIVSFNHFTAAPTLQVPPAKSMEALAVHWLFNNAEVEGDAAKLKVHKALGFTGNPKIVYVDEVPDGDMDTLSFSFYGGTKCSPRSPCTVSIQHKTDPEPLGTFEAKIVHQSAVLVKAKLLPSDIGWAR